MVSVTVDQYSTMQALHAYYSQGCCGHDLTMKLLYYLFSTRSFTVKSCSETTQNKATLAHSNGNACIAEYWSTVTDTIATIPSEMKNILQMFRKVGMAKE